MIELRHCPRCAGFLFLETFPGNETDLVCAQCGYRVHLKTESPYTGISKGRTGKEPARRAA